MYKILDVNKDDYILDATCGSGGFLVKAMANMIREVGGMQTDAAAEIKSSHLFGIEFDREIMHWHVQTCSFIKTVKLTLSRWTPVPICLRVDEIEAYHESFDEPAL